MSGSSRSLSRALETVFTEDKDISDIITQYIEKHNEFTIVQNQTIINDELYKIYNEYIKPSEDISKEFKFLDILTLICCVFNKQELNIWVQTYLKPAVDSAGYDLKFVEKSREYINRVTVEFIDSNDFKLNEFRLNYAKSVIRLILESYLNDSKLLENLNIKIEVDQKNTQVYHERIRFIKSNCKNILKKFGDKHTKEFCELLSDSLKTMEYRGEALILFGDFISQKNFPEIIKFPLFNELLKIIAEDIDEVVVHTALTDLSLLIPQVAKDLGKYITDLFLICIRIINWNELKRSNNNESAETLPKYGVTINFNIQHFVTLLYGLFFYNISEFVQSPKDYLTQNPLQVLSIFSLSPFIEERTKSVLERLLESFLLHPKIFIKDKDELTNPTSWIKNCTSPEDVAINCLSLNPNIIIKPTPRKNSISTIDKISRSSSLAGPMYMQANGPTKQILARKLSIIPTNLVIEDDIRFKDIKFNNKLDSVPSSPDSTKAKEIDPLHNLLNDHEKLFATRHDQIEPLDEKKSELKITRPISSPTTTMDSSIVSKEFSTTDSNTSGIKSQTSLNNMNGAIDFYQRELLLFKNELEFSSYMKHLNKFHYLRMNQRDVTETTGNYNEELSAVISELRKENLKNKEEFIRQRDILIDKIDDLNKEKAELTQTYLNFKKQTEIQVQNYTKMVEEIIPDKDYKIESLKSKLSILENEEPKIETKIIKEQFDTSDYEKQIYSLKTQIQLINNELNNSIQENKTWQLKYDEIIKQNEINLSKTKLSINENLSSFTSNYDKKNQELKTILIKYEKLIEEKNNKILQLSSSKPIPIQRSISGLRHESVSSLNSSIRNDEYSYNREQNSGGININDELIYNTNHQTPAPIQQMMRKNEKSIGFNSNSNNNNNSSNTDALPIMRGRGGLQKRTKKMM
ncbi:uncharacterized protein KGF55_000514 [Candida pseudojiufengensis]|uniref:uncharacterized protein n=1 Tax=Candida pseudojiufengensis TaxID=497109 RepID=UPI002224CCEE|nr:uncharacterized protein KGF55_000514 [Candida pseudojiufengensis]KAI5966205.1 hypothetical protein KGF55_000514 [Candida pseudojiufengensis]